MVVLEGTRPAARMRPPLLVYLSITYISIDCSVYGPVRCSQPHVILPRFFLAAIDRRVAYEENGREDSNNLYMIEGISPATYSIVLIIGPFFPGTRKKSLHAEARPRGPSNRGRC